MRKWLIVISCIGMLLLLPIYALAHSGRTDGNGGHHDGDDYHYHHGYPAHDHWDMDGDGDADCPYLFDDKTGQNSGGAGNFKQDQGISQNQGNSIATGGSSVSHGMHPLFWVVAGILLIWAIYRLVQIVCKEVKEILAIRANNRKVLQSLGRENVRIPRGVALFPDGTPTRGMTDFDRPYGDYTVYASPKGTRFHASRRCCPKGNPEHLFEIKKRLSPCRHCASSPQYIGGIPNWYSELTKPGSNHNGTKE